MKITHRVVAVACAAAVITPAYAVYATEPAGATFEFAFTEHPTNAEYTISGQHVLQPTGPLAPGDSVEFREDLFEGNTNVGFDNGQCLVTFNDNLMCTAVFAFTNKGDLVLTALIRGGAVQPQSAVVFDAAVTGGTFAYRNAHGDGHAVGQPNGDVDWTLNFVTG